MFMKPENTGNVVASMPGGGKMLTETVRVWPGRTRTDELLNLTMAEALVNGTGPTFSRRVPWKKFNARMYDCLNSY